MLAVIQSTSSYSNNQGEFNISMIQINHIGNQYYLDKHDKKNDHNNSTIMISYNWNNLTTSYFKNSHFNDTYYFGFFDKIELSENYNIGYSVGISYGYYLKNVFKKDNPIRKKLYNNYDGWDKLLLPLGYIYMNRKLTQNMSIGALLVGKNAYGLYYNFNI
jgi:hypothetical protein